MEITRVQLEETGKAGQNLEKSGQYDWTGKVGHGVRRS